MHQASESVPAPGHRTAESGGSRPRATAALPACRPLWFLIVISLISGCSNPRLDSDLCPIAPKPEKATVLLIDTSDPLTLKHREKLATVLGELMQPSGAGGTYVDEEIEPGEEFLVYELPGRLDELEPTLRVCNPGGDPETRTLKDDLLSGEVIETNRWKRFTSRVERLYDERSQEPLSHSLILETIGVIIARHAPTQRAHDPHRLHLILYSDLLQHSDADGLSHYGAYPEAEDLVHQPGLRHLKSDLSSVDVSIYRLEREVGSVARWQTTEHYYWWQDLVEAFRGRVIWLESV